MSARYSVNDLREYLREGTKKGATHMFIVFQETGRSPGGKIERNDQHYYVMRGKEVKEVITQTLSKICGYKELLEVYDLGKPIEPQLKEQYAFNF